MFEDNLNIIKFFYILISSLVLGFGWITFSGGWHEFGILNKFCIELYRWQTNWWFSIKWLINCNNCHTIVYHVASEAITTDSCAQCFSGICVKSDRCTINTGEASPLWHISIADPNHSCILIQESFRITIHLYLVKQLKIESSDIFKSWYISKISMFILSVGTSLFEVLPLCFRKSHYFKNC